MTAIWNPDSPSRVRYTTVAILLHWTIAALILFNIVTGFLHDALPRGAMAIHISSGITVLALTLVRIAWRLTHRPPPFLPMKPWERGLAHVVHSCLYAAMLLMPISGWAMISANPPIGSPGAAYAESLRNPGALPTAPRPAAARRMVWWLIPLPLIKPLQDMGRAPEGVPVQREKHEQIEQFHGSGGLILVFLLFLHIGGALKHQFFDRERELARMGLGRR